jgi:hypothetical protein
MNERELLVDCLRRLSRTGATYYLTSQACLECHLAIRSTAWRCRECGCRASGCPGQRLFESLGAGIETDERIGTVVERENQTETNLIGGESSSRFSRRYGAVSALAVFSNETTSATFNTWADLSIRFMKLLRAVPGPSSMNRVKPCARR